MTNNEKKQLKIYLTGYNTHRNWTIKDFLNSKEYVSKSKKIKTYLKGASK